MNNKGFTLIEVLIVIGIIAILAAVVIVAINPGRQFDKANDTDRSADASQIVSKISEYSVDNRGAVPVTITAVDTEICATGATSCDGLIDLAVLTDSGTYLDEMPQDPECSDVCATNGTGYFVVKEANGKITVSAPYAALTTISFTQ
ncbi:MAG: type II secretion system protein [Parcubacteria group bacterium]